MKASQKISVKSKVLYACFIAIGVAGLAYSLLYEDLEYCRKGDYERKGKNYVQAVEFYTHCLEEGRLSRAAKSRTLILRAVSLEANGRIEKAITDIDRVLEIEPKSALALYLRGDAHRRLGRFDRALADIERAIELKPSSVPFRIARIATRIDMQDFRQAIVEIDIALRKEMHKAELHRLRAFTYQQLEELDNALAEINRAIELEPLSAIGYQIRGVIHTTLGAYSDALADLTKAHRFEPKKARIIAARAAAHAVGGNLDDALADLSKAIELDPQISDLYLQRAFMLMEKGAYNQAVEQNNIALKVNPTNDSVYSQRGWLELHRGDYESSLKNLYRAFELGANDVRSLVWSFRTEARFRSELEARQGLRKRLKNLNLSRWPGPIAEFFAGIITESQLLARSSDQNPIRARHKMCDSRFYIAQLSLLRDDNSSAELQLEKALTDCSYRFARVHGSRAIGTHQSLGYFLRLPTGQPFRRLSSEPYDSSIGNVRPLLPVPFRRLGVPHGLVQ